MLSKLYRTIKHYSSTSFQHFVAQHQPKNIADVDALSRKWFATQHAGLYPYN
jgi:hypothetical protein